MSTLKAEVVKIKTVSRHPNADRLDLLTFEGMDWVCITGRNDPAVPKYSPSFMVVYLPIDSLIPQKLEDYLFPPDSKIKLSNHRLKTIKLRGCVSQGMAIDISKDLIKLYPALAKAKLGDDVTAILEITKYEPPIKDTPAHMQGKAKKHNNPLFKQYTDIENLKYYPDAFDGMQVYVSEKLHGSSFRAANLPREADTLFEKILAFFNLLPKYEYCFGSRRVQLQEKPRHKTFYDDNIYAIVSEKYKLKDILLPGYAVYGEIVGQGIQSGYAYGCSQGECKLFVYDVKIDGKYLGYDDFKRWCYQNKMEPVPELYTGFWNKEQISFLRTGDSHVGNQPVREGVVVKPMRELIDPRLGRLVLKWINDDYLCQDFVTDLH